MTISLLAISHSKSKRFIAIVSEDVQLGWAASNTQYLDVLKVLVAAPGGSLLTLWLDFLLAASENTCSCDEGTVATDVPLIVQCRTIASEPAVIS